MTLTEVENLAAQSGAATPDYPLKAILRYKVIPEVLIDLGNVWWTRGAGSVTTVAGSRDYNLPVDFLRARIIGTPANYTTSVPEDGLQYVGENEELTLSLEQATGQGAPTRYRIVIGANGRRQIRFYPTPDAAYTFPFSYTKYLRVQNQEEDQDLAVLAPEPAHWIFVEGLRREIMRDRFGEGDARYAVADNEYRSWIRRLDRMDMRQPGPRGHHSVYAR